METGPATHQTDSAAAGVRDALAGADSGSRGAGRWCRRYRFRVAAGRGVSRRGEQGSVSLEVVLLVPVMVLLALFVLWAGRGGRAALITDLAAEEAATAAALSCEEGKPGCEDLVVDVLRARPGLDFLCIGGPRPRPGQNRILEASWLGRDEAVLDTSGDVDVQNTEVSGVGVLSVAFVCETDGAVAPLRGVFPTVEFRGQASEVAILQGAPKASLNDAEVVEGNPGDTVTLRFLLTLDAPVTADVSIPYVIDGGSPEEGWATEGEDYRVPAAAWVVVAEGATEAVIEVPVVPDVLYEAAERLVLRLDDPDPDDLGLISLDPAERDAVGTILNDDPLPLVAVSDAAEVTEGDGARLVFEVRAGPSGAVTTVGYETRDTGTARTDNQCGGGTDPDYVSAGGTLEFAPSAVGQADRVEVVLDDDLCGEGPETVDLWLTGPVGARFGAAADGGSPCPVESDDDPATPSVDESASRRDDCAVGVIADDEPGLEINDVSACEVVDRVECGDRGDTGGRLVFTVRRVGTKTPKVTVRYATIPDDAPNAHLAAAGLDYTPEAGPCSAGSPLVTIPADRTGAQTVAVAVLPDDLDEDDETFLVELCDPSDNAWISRERGRGTIFDDDAPPTVSVADGSEDEGAAGAAISFDVELSAPTGRAAGVSVKYCTDGGADGGTAEAGDDYTEVSCSPSRQGEVWFGPGETLPQQAEVVILPDDLDEDDETVVLRLEASNAGFADSSGETGACPPEVPDDPNTGADESANTGDRCAVGVIVDDDDPPLLRVGTARGVEGSELAFTVRLVSAADGATPVAAQRPVTAGWRVVHAAVEGTDDADFSSPLSGTVVFGVGDETAPVTVSTVNDELDEHRYETFDVELTLMPADSADPEAAVDAATAGTGTVIDNDVAPLAVIVECPDPELARRLDPCPAGAGWSAVEGNALTFTVRLDKPSGRDVALGWRTVQKTPPAADVATGASAATDAGADYVNAAGTVAVGAGARTGAFAVLSVDDAADERDYEFFEVRLDPPPAGPDPAYRLGADTAADGRIVDNDNLELRLFAVCDGAPAARACVSESDDNVLLRVGLVDADTDLSVRAASVVEAYFEARERPSEGEKAAQASTPDRDLDFTAVARGNVRIPSGSDGANISVAVHDDDLDEHDEETFVVRLVARPDGGASVGSQRLAVVAIRDDDPMPTVTVADASAGEGAGVGFTLELNKVSGRTVSVDYRTVADGTAAAGTGCTAAADFVAVAATTASFAPGEQAKTVSVDTCSDSLDEDDDETFTLKLGGFDGVKASTAAASPCPAQALQGAGTDTDDCAVGRITDDDPRPKLSLEGPAANLDESSGTAAFTARLDNPSGRRVTATVTLEDGTATGGQDCNSTPPPDHAAPAAGISIEFAPGSTADTFTVTICDDNIDEPDTETFTARIDPATVQNADLDTARAAATVTIEDNDDIFVEIVDCPDTELAKTLDPCPNGIGAQAQEGDNLEFTVRLVDNGGQPSSSHQTVTVTAATRSLTGAQAAAAGSDYTAVSRPLTFTPGQATQQTVAVPTLTDTDTEPEERLQLRLTNLSANASRGDYIAVGVINAQCHPVADDQDPPRIEATGASVDEGDELSMQLEMDPRPCEPVGVRVRVQAGTASGPDFAGGSVPGPTTTTATGPWRHRIGTRDDNIDEPDETFRVLIDYFGAGNPPTWNSADPEEVTVTIADDDTSEVRVLAAEADEGDSGMGVAPVPFTLSVPNSRDVLVRFRPVATNSAAAPATAGGSCTGGADFVAGTYVATIPAGRTTGTGTMNICGDTATEEDETLQVRIESASTRSTPSETLSIAVQRAQFTIVDDDEDDCVDPDDGNSAVPALSVSDAGAVESVASMRFTVSIDGEVCEGKSLPVSYRTVDGTATAGSDYRAASGRTAIAAGQSSTAVNVGLINDDRVEGSETFTLRASWGTGLPQRYTSEAAATGQGTIEDDDGDWLLEVSDAGPVNEGQTLRFTVSLVDANGAPAPSTERVTVDYYTLDLTATAGEDYTGVSVSSPRQLVFQPGDTSEPVAVATAVDSLEEADERFQVRLTNPSNAGIRNRGIGVGTIRGDCVDPGNGRHGRPEVSFGPLQVSEGAGAAPFRLDIGCTTTAASWRLEFLDGTAAVTPESTDVSAGYTFAADSAADAAAANRLEKAAAGVPARISGRIAVNDDELDEPDETLGVRVSWVGDLPSHWGSRHWEFTVTITDDDAPTVVAFNDLGVLENAGPATLVLELETAAVEATSVRYTTVAQTPGSNSATSGTDYTHVQRDLDIPAGSRRLDITVDITNDDLVESDETFLVRLSAPRGGLNLRDDTAQVTIEDDDRCVDPSTDPPPQWRQATGFPNDHRWSQYNAAEEGESIWMGIEIDRPLCRSLQFRVQYTGAGTAESNDFRTGTGVGSSWRMWGVTETRYSTTQAAFPVFTFEDNEIEEDETFTFRVYWCRHDGGRHSLCRNNDGLPQSWLNASLLVEGTIIDDDDPEVTVANVAAVEAAEDAGEMVFVMELDPPPKTVAEVRYLTWATPSEGDRAATRGRDYTHTEDTLSIPVGAGRARIPVPIVDDNLVEFDETFLLRLQAVSGLRMADPWAQGTILDDDAPEPDMSLAGPDPDGVFEGGSMDFTVTLSEPATRRITVGYRTVDGTASAGADYTGASGTLTFSRGDTAQTVTVATIDDSASTGAVTFYFELHSESRARVVGPRRVEAVIYDDERPPPVTLSVTGASAREGEPLEFAVTLDVPSLRAVTLPYQTADGTATAGADYTARAGNLAFRVGDRSGTISVPTARDNDDGEGDETMSLTFGTATNASAPAGAATGTIRDGPAIGTPEFSVADAVVDKEGDDLVFTVTLDPAPSARVVVQYRTVDSTAVAPGDYTATVGRLTFIAGQTSETVRVATVSDDVYELDEVLLLELARVVSGDAVIVDAEGEGTIIGDKVTISVSDAVVDEETDSSRARTLGGHIEVRLDRPLDIPWLPYSLVFRSETTLRGYSGSGHNPFNDFFTRTGCFSFRDGATVSQCEIVTNDDSRYEGNETAEVLLIVHSGCVSDWGASRRDRETCIVPSDYAVVGDGTATLTITEDERPPQIGAVDASIEEGETVTLNLSLSGSVSDRTITLDWATEDGTAEEGTDCRIAGTDYLPGSGTVTFFPADDVNPGGIREQAIRLRTCPDAAREGNEAFYVRLSRPHHATLLGDSDNDGEVLVEITILDND